MQKSAGRKFNERELKGVPVRIAVGRRDLEQGQVEIFRRDTLEKSFVQIDHLAHTVQELFLDIQQNIYINQAIISITSINLMNITINN